MNSIASNFVYLDPTGWYVDNDPNDITKFDGHEIYNVWIKLPLTTALKNQVCKTMPGCYNASSEMVQKSIDLKQNLSRYYAVSFCHEGTGCDSPYIVSLNAGPWTPITPDSLDDILAKYLKKYLIK